MIRLAALLCGLICGAGFLLSGLHAPIPPRLAPTPQLLGPLLAGALLLAVILAVGALVVLLRRRNPPLLGGEAQPAAPDAGWTPRAAALLFGLGWGVAGYFPMAALVSAGTLSPGAALFLVCVLAGMVLSDLVSGRRKLGGAGTGRLG